MRDSKCRRRQRGARRQADRFLRTDDILAMYGYHYAGPSEDTGTNYRPLPPLPRHMSSTFSNPPSPVDNSSTLPLSSAGSTPAGDSENASPVLNFIPTPATAPGSAGASSAGKKRAGGAAQPEDGGGSGLQSPAEPGDASAQKDSTGKDGKATKRVKVSLVNERGPADGS